MGNADLICHYTSMEGFKSIIQSKKIWATNVLFLNDTKEYLHAFDVFQAEVEKLKIELKNLSEKDTLFFSGLAQCMDEMDYIGAEQHYVTSFSKNIDQLSQWRAYGSIGIVFNKALFENSLNTHNQLYCRMKPCRYDTEGLQEMITAKIRKLYTDYLNSSNHDAIYRLATDLQIYLYNRAAFLKDKGFHEEREYRVSYASTGDEEVKFRATDSCLVPYVEIAFDQHAIDSIYIGPSVEPKRAEKSIELFLYEHFPDNPPKVHKSQCTYRNW
ncbi:DUF2971 domain-containing protein [Pseudidiomarina gelatinasegens]|uniref:DUF2971 domain-containing protein n=1 Tax=Pseudidiomarina gelatinasegens TaxID=2487740 RepID=A0A443YYP1_9GAMM|nr:DUF2971 domain-containing protein [Pseudidiomarina gelatinasegens]RWU09217.1 DUF2971 domain-containing protein [Pseudidiomarina gelatinasegens]